MSIESVERLTELKLHQTITVCAGMTATKVPNGWLYANSDMAAMTFVPEIRRTSIEITDAEVKVIKGLFV